MSSLFTLTNPNVITTINRDLSAKLRDPSNQRLFVNRMLGMRLLCKLHLPTVLEGPATLSDIVYPISQYVVKKYRNAVTVRAKVYSDRIIFAPEQFWLDHLLFIYGVRVHLGAPMRIINRSKVTWNLDELHDDFNPTNVTDNYFKDCYFTPTLDTAIQEWPDRPDAKVFHNGVSERSWHPSAHDIVRQQYGDARGLPQMKHCVSGAAGLRLTDVALGWLARCREEVVRFLVLSDGQKVNQLDVRERRALQEIAGSVNVWL